MNDQYLISVYTSMVRDYGASMDDILADPDLRQAFLKRCRVFMKAVPERELLRRIIYLRKRSRLLRQVECHRT